MILSQDGRRLWRAADRMNRSALDRAGPIVSAARRCLPPLLAFSDPTRLSRPWDVAERLPEGSGMVYRHFGDPQAETIGSRLRAITRRRGLILLVGLDADLAERVEADGVHLPERAGSSAAALAERRPDWLLTVAAHSVRAAVEARKVDAVVLSPIFAAGGASAARRRLGVKALSEAANRSVCPVYALGGIGPGNVEALADSGACGVAGVGAFQQAFGESCDVRT